MTGLLRWESGQRRHVGDLQLFECTSFKPPRVLRGWPPHNLPDWWEYEVQQEIRSFRPPLGRGRHLWLGYDDEGLAAVITWQELDGPAEVELEYGAVALRHRRVGGGYADELSQVLFDEVTARAIEGGVAAVSMTAYVWNQNRPSQALCRRMLFAHVAEAAPGVQVWHRELLVGALEDDLLEERLNRCRSSTLTSPDPPRRDTAPRPMRPRGGALSRLTYCFGVPISLPNTSVP